MALAASMDTVSTTDLLVQSPHRRPDPPAPCAAQTALGARRDRSAQSPHAPCGLPHDHAHLQPAIRGPSADDRRQNLRRRHNATPAVHHPVPAPKTEASRTASGAAQSDLGDGLADQDGYDRSPTSGTGDRRSCQPRRLVSSAWRTSRRGRSGASSSLPVVSMAARACCAPTTKRCLRRGLSASHCTSWAYACNTASRAALGRMAESSG